MHPTSGFVLHILPEGPDSVLEQVELGILELAWALQEVINSPKPLNLATLCQYKITHCGVKAPYRLEARDLLDAVRIIVLGHFPLFAQVAAIPKGISKQKWCESAGHDGGGDGTRTCFELLSTPKDLRALQETLPVPRGTFQHLPLIAL